MSVYLLSLLSVEQSGQLHAANCETPRPPLVGLLIAHPNISDNLNDKEIDEAEAMNLQLSRGYPGLPVQSAA